MVLAALLATVGHRTGCFIRSYIALATWHVTGYSVDNSRENVLAVLLREIEYWIHVVVPATLKAIVGETY